ncbi:MAG: SPOR domain-containing protein [Pseudomonadota bacterium]|nr:SPOR domain-containing protein [Pseudomonadota bacterium]
MERPVKERLIGAAVLMAAAVILIPEMLSGPDRESGDKQAQTGTDGEGTGEASIKTYTIDLSQSPGAQPPTVTAQNGNRAPPPEELPTASTEAPPPETQVSPEPEPVAPPVVAERPKPEPRTEPPPRQLAAQPARAEAPPQGPPKPEPKPEPPKAEPRAVASAPSAPRSAVPTGKGWAVQLGSYSSETTAQRLANEWRAKGQSAFVMPVTTGGKTLYRVRIGPSKDRAGAEAALKAVKPSIPNAAVVAHP